MRTGPHSTEGAPMITTWPDDDVPPTSGAQLEHRPGCTGAALVERETPRRRLLVCSGCSALVALPRVARWQEAE